MSILNSGVPYGLFAGDGGKGAGGLGAGGLGGLGGLGDGGRGEGETGGLGEAVGGRLRKRLGDGGGDVALTLVGEGGFLLLEITMGPGDDAAGCSVSKGLTRAGRGGAQELVLLTGEGCDPAESRAHKIPVLMQPAQVFRIQRAAWDAEGLATTWPVAPKGWHLCVPPCHTQHLALRHAH